MNNLSPLAAFNYSACRPATPDASLVSHSVNIFLLGKGKRVAGNQNNTR